MADHHPHASAIDRVGSKIVRHHFELSRAALSGWRIRGVPRNARKPLALLGQHLGYEMPELPRPFDPQPNAGR